MGSRLVPDQTIHTSTGKNHKTDEKVPILRCTFIHQYLILKRIIPLHPVTIELRSVMIKINEFPVFTEKLAPPFCQFCFGLVLTPKKHFSLVRALVFSIFIGIPLEPMQQNLI